MAKKKTHCKYGHPLIKENLVLSELKRGKRRCKTCRNQMDKERRNPQGNLSPALINKEKTHCLKGHPLSGTNLRIDKTGRRICRACKRLTSKEQGKKPEVKLYKLTWQQEHRDKVSSYNKGWNKKNRKSYSKNWDIKNPSKRKAINKRHNHTPKRKQYRRQWQRENPRSFTGLPMEVQVPMNNVRERQKNTCQWYGCGKTAKETTIHVHHIFPRKEYPDLETDERYMICYCQFHHALWHEKRNDTIANLIRYNHRRKL